ncbi:MAG: 2-dehydropantoate 2-reductase [Myxococcales bacterium]|nr:2-dehydropantoate 2-reductase [Myxococcales bacterium]
MSLAVQVLNIGVIGAGSIGCWVGGMLASADVGHVTFVGRQRVRDEIAEHGLIVRGMDDAGAPVPPERYSFVTDAKGLAACELVLCSVKSAQTDEAGATLAGVLGRSAVVVSLQNGLGNAKALRSKLGDRRVVAGIVGFNVVSRGGGVFQRTMSGPLTFERCEHPGWRAALDGLGRLRVELEELDDIAPAQATKLLINLNNAVSAISGAPTRELLASAGYRRIVAALVEEGLLVLRAAGYRPARLRGVPVGWMPPVLRLPSPIVRVVLRAQMRVDAEARSSMWEDLTRGRPTEVDWLNGEIVRLADKSGVSAPLNRRLVELVHDAERAGRGPVGMSAEQLWRALTA